MLTANFHITAFIWFPLSIILVICAVAMIVRREVHGSRTYYLLMGILPIYLTIQQTMATMRVIGETPTSGLHLFLQLAVIANMWAAAMGMLALSLQHEIERRRKPVAGRNTASESESSTAHHTPADRWDSPRA
jgi:hypothetical protein